MKIHHCLQILILLWVINGCNQTQRSETVGYEESATIEAFEPVDVYKNPNSFEQYMGRLKPGDLPPAMRVEKWYNGSPVERFEKGTVYVVEFFASWCQPCRKSIPHLNKLQQEFKEDLVVIAVAASESEPNTAKLDKLLHAKKEVLTYRVAYTSDEKTFKDWNWGARNTGLPWAFIVNEKGELAWFGQPFQSRFEPVLRSVLNDTYIPENITESNEEDYEARRVLWEVQENFWNAVGDNDWPATLSLGEQLYVSGDQLFYYEMAQLFQIRYERLGKKKESITYAEKLVSGPLNGIPEGLGLIAEVIERDSLAAEESNALALNIAEETNRLTYYENSELLSLLGRLYAKTVQRSKARETFQKALKYNDDTELEQEIMDELELLVNE
ncbi:redoxin family protein [Reichenbachiella sp.]|uniref:redoxin family protein n=1 Tax=Reichenbachiella sp. TaxID=2184521 RepID=UPI0032993BF3